MTVYYPVVERFGKRLEDAAIATFDLSKTRLQKDGSVLISTKSKYFSWAVSLDGFIELQWNFVDWPRGHQHHETLEGAERELVGMVFG